MSSLLRSLRSTSLAACLVAAISSVFSSQGTPIASEGATYRLSQRLGSANSPVEPATNAAARQRFVALIVPQTSKSLATAAEAVRAGFQAGARAEGKNAAPYRIYPVDDEGPALVAAYRRALSEGAIAVVAGMTRDGANVLAREAGLVPSLALNAPTGVAAPEQFYFVSLSLENEARALAREAITESRRRAVLVAGTTPLAKRLAESFEREWLAKGGSIIARINVSGEPADGARLKVAAEKWQDVGMVFLAADARSTRLLRPFLPVSLLVYASSHSLNPYASAVESLDVEGLRFVEMPWFVERDHLAVMSYPKPAEPLAVEYERLYALGIDAWRLVQTISAYQPGARTPPPLDGVTGRLTLDGSNQFVRSLAHMEMREGRAKLVRAVE